MKNILIAFLFGVAGLLIPASAYAAPFVDPCPAGQRPTATGCEVVPAGGGGINIGLVTQYSSGILALINQVFVPVLFAIAFLTFLYGVYKYFILGATDPKARSDGQQFVLWGIIGFAVILSVWGLVAIVGRTFGLEAGGTAPIPPTL